MEAVRESSAAAVIVIYIRDSGRSDIDPNMAGVLRGLCGQMGEAGGYLQINERSDSAQTRALSF